MSMTEDYEGAQDAEEEFEYVETEGVPDEFEYPLGDEAPRRTIFKKMIRGACGDCKPVNPSDPDDWEGFNQIIRNRKTVIAFFLGMILFTGIIVFSAYLSSGAVARVKFYTTSSNPVPSGPLDEVWLTHNMSADAGNATFTYGNVNFVWIPKQTANEMRDNFTKTFAVAAHIASAGEFYPGDLLMPDEDWSDMFLLTSQQVKDTSDALNVNLRNPFVTPPMPADNYYICIYIPIIANITEAGPYQNQIFGVFGFWGLQEIMNGVGHLMRRGQTEFTINRIVTYNSSVNYNIGILGFPALLDVEIDYQPWPTNFF